MTNDDNDFGGKETEPTSAENGTDTGRRKLITVGALLVPAIATLHATPAWANTNYTMTAYRYGTNVGKCRNEEYEPGVNDEFIACDGLEGRIHEEVGGEQQQGPGPSGF